MTLARVRVSTEESTTTARAQEDTIKCGFLGERNLACKLQGTLGQMSYYQTLIARYEA